MHPRHHARDKQRHRITAHRPEGPYCSQSSVKETMKAAIALLLTLVHRYAAQPTSPALHRQLPAKVLVGYASQNHTNVIDAVIQDGVNVVIWAFIEIRPDDLILSTHRHRSMQSSASIVTNLDLTAVNSTIHQLNDAGYPIPHLVSLGGWNGRHLDARISSLLWMETWHSSGLSNIFDGIDWDFEGSDDLESEKNVFDLDCLEKMGEISQIMKQSKLLKSACTITFVFV